MRVRLQAVELVVMESEDNDRQAEKLTCDRSRQTRHLRPASKVTKS